MSVVRADERALAGRRARRHHEGAVRGAILPAHDEDTELNERVEAPRPSELDTLRVAASARDEVGDYPVPLGLPSIGGVAPAFVEGIDWSDHWAFTQHGIPAIMVTDTAPFRYPHYHQLSDTPNKIDYDRLARMTPSPIIELNRAVAVTMALGPQAGLEIVDTLASEPLLASYHLLPSVRGDVLFKLGRFDEARQEFEHAASLAQNARERNLLLERARSCTRA